MRAIVMRENGGPEVLRLEEVDDPEPGEGEVLVEVEAAGVNHYDLNQRSAAATPPKILGSDAVGWATAGTGNQRVLVTNARGAYAERTVAKAEDVYPLPEQVTAAAGAALGVPYRTAWWALVDLGELAAGQRVLVQAGSSATGQAAVDIARARGATVYATASASKLDRIRDLGAEALVYDDPALERLGVDLVFDPVGSLGASVRALREDGRVVTPGALGDPQATIDVWALVGKRARVIGTGSAPARRETIEELISLVAHGELAPAIDRELPLEQAAEAHRAIEARETFGKVILRP